MFNYHQFELKGVGMALILTDMIITTLPVVYGKPHNGYPFQDRDEMPHNAAFHQDLHCLSRLKTIIRPKNTIFFEN